ncbi:hypothetical protein [Paenibacillus lautus]|uniref:Phage portal protein n=1 Tax=Paenibacillus lautus TaxID=1401 RepID=A0A385TDR6_PAELA|nr:hypothetical protein [Paenibacillus lautus]AYB41799.1 hypothetical protein D5F53_00130 [Paenibacillus lautus]MCA4756331.1 hypothetical protein [Mycolicibacterium fortuitum]
MDIVFAANSFEEVRRLPVLPPEMNIEHPWNNEEFQTMNLGTINLIGTPGLRSLAIESFFPMRIYPFMKDKRLGWSYVQFFRKWRERRVPLRVIITDNKEQEVLNMPCTIDNFVHGWDRSGDIRYSLAVKEFKFVKVT